MHKQPYSLVGILKMDTVYHNVGNIGNTVGLIGGNGQKIVSGVSAEVMYVKIPSRAKEMESVLILIMFLVGQVNVHTVDIYPFPVDKKTGKGSLVDYIYIADEKIPYSHKPKGYGKIAAALRTGHIVLLTSAIVVVCSAYKADILILNVVVGIFTVGMALCHIGIGNYGAVRAVGKEKSAGWRRALYDRIGIYLDSGYKGRPVHNQVYSHSVLLCYIEYSLYCGGIVGSPAAVHVAVENSTALTCHKFFYSHKITYLIIICSDV